MNFLQRFLGKKPVATPLEVFLSAITTEQPTKTYRAISEHDLKLPSAVAVWALYLAHRFCLGFRKMHSALDKGNSPLPYDPIAVEATAYCYYWLMKDFIQDSDESDVEDMYFNDLQASAIVAHSLLAQYIPFALESEFLLKRVMAFSMADKFGKTSAHERFGQQLLSSINRGAPVLQVGPPPEDDLALQLVTATYTPIFYSAYHDELRKSARVMYLAHEDGVL